VGWLSLGRGECEETGRVPRTSSSGWAPSRPERLISKLPSTIRATLRNAGPTMTWPAVISGAWRYSFAPGVCWWSPILCRQPGIFVRELGREQAPIMLSPAARFSASLPSPCCGEDAWWASDFGVTVSGANHDRRPRGPVAASSENIHWVNPHECSLIAAERVG